MRPKRHELVFWLGSMTLGAAVLQGNAWMALVGALLVSGAAAVDFIPQRSDPTREELARIIATINAITLKVGMKPLGEK